MIEYKINVNNKLKIQARIIKIIRVKILMDY